jgi:hypothetical protein
MKVRAGIDEMPAFFLMSRSERVSAAGAG